MNTQYRKNLKAVAQACKDYTDNKIKKVYFDIGHNDITTDDHTNELAYQITAPANAKLLMLQSIGGNCVKYNPSVASDSTKAMIKTMPSTVYTFDGSKFYGDSEVSENLLVLQDVAETTINGITYKVENGVATLNGTATETTIIQIMNNLNLNGTYTLTSFGTTYNNDVLIIVRDITLTYNRLLCNNGSSDTQTINENGARVLIRVAGGSTITNYIVKPMLVKGSTAPTEFKVGYEGIHNLELTGIKSEGANLWSLTQPAFTGVIDISSFLQNTGVGNYAFKVTSSRNVTYPDFHWYIRDVTTATTLLDGILTNTQYTFNYTNELVGHVIQFYAWGQSYSEDCYMMWNRGSTALAYVPYVAPTTKTIDLSTILYNGSPLFEGNSLKAVGTAKDYITPYLAHKQMGIVDLSTLNYTYTTDSDKPRWYVNFTSAKIPSSSTTVPNMICNSYEVVSETDGWNNVSGLSITTTSLLVIYGTTQPSGLLVYELATPIEVSIDWSSTLRGIQGYSNGSIIAENTHNMEVESVITYNSIIQETLCPSVTITRNGADILTRNLPTQASDGYGVNANVHNLRVFSDYEGNETKERHIIVGKVDLGSLDWNKGITNNGNYYNYATLDSTTSTYILLCANYTPYTENQGYQGSNPADLAYLENVGIGLYQGAVIIYDTNYNDDNATTFKTTMSGVYLYYELATEDISQLDDFDYFFDVEEGDIITFNNPYAQQVYATYSFLIKEAKSNE